MSNPTVILNGDQVYCDELIRENARLTIQHEADRLTLEQKNGKAWADCTTPKYAPEISGNAQKYR